MKTDVEKHVCAIFYAPVINQSMHVACHATTKRFVGFFFYSFTRGRLLYEKDVSINYENYTTSG
jgi:hypothetical protein